MNWLLVHMQVQQVQHLVNFVYAECISSQCAVLPAMQLSLDRVIVEPDGHMTLGAVASRAGVANADALVQRSTTAPAGAGRWRE